MKERPIIFSAPMVRALLAGSKTQTRRIVKPQPKDCAHLWHDGNSLGAEPFIFAGRNIDPEEVCCPYGKPGDRLWVRETWGVADLWVYSVETNPPRTIAYRADHSAHDFDIGEDVDTGAWGWERMKCRPSIFMPRWASRITLDVTGVRLERLQDISEADAVAEGTPCYVCGQHMDGRSEDDCHCFHRRADGTDYRMLWESINGAGSWDANPWVWCLEYQRVTP